MKVGNRYDLYIWGKAKGKDAQIGTLFMEQLVPEQLYEIVDNIINTYNEQGEKREPFFKFVNRIGFENLKHQIAE